MYRAEFMRNALVMAGLGGLVVRSEWLIKYWRSSAQPPVTQGVEWLVPEEAV